MTNPMALIENSPVGQIVRSAGVDLVTPRGDPVAPQDLVRRLKALSPRYDLRWVSGAWGQSYFGLFEAWKEGDKRWERVQTGELSPERATDLMYTFPPECSVNDMAAYVEQRFGIRRDPRAEADKLVAEAEKLYRQASEDAVDKTIEASIERRERESNHDLEVRGGFATPTPMVDVTINVKTEPKRLIPKG